MILNSTVLKVNMADGIMAAISKELKEQIAKNPI